MSCSLSAARTLTASHMYSTDQLAAGRCVYATFVHACMSACVCVCEDIERGLGAAFQLLLCFNAQYMRSFRGG